jgi:hypothetical protein
VAARRNRDGVTPMCSRKMREKSRGIENPRSSATEVIGASCLLHQATHRLFNADGTQEDLWCRVQLVAEQGEEVKKCLANDPHGAATSSAVVAALACSRM